MANTLRSVNTKFWNDPFIEDLTPSEKLLFLYLLTNPLCTLLGIYEITYKRISYDTGLNNETIRKGFERFGNDKKAFFEENYVILPNFLKNQNLNLNMKVAVVKQFNELPEWLKDKVLGNDSKGLPNGSEAFEMVRNGLVMVRKVEVEVEEEIESEVLEDPKQKTVNELYKEWLDDSDNDKYKGFVEWLLSEDLEFALSLKEQLSEKWFSKIYKAANFNGETIKAKLFVINAKKGEAKAPKALGSTLYNYLVNDFNFKK